MNTPICDSSARQTASRPREGFTAIELLALLAVVCLLAMAAAPALSRTKPNNRSVQCLNNMRAMIAGWQMYAQDNSDRMVTQVHGGTAQGGIGDPTYGVSWVEGWLDWTTATDNTNVALLVGERYAKLAKYVRDPATYKCPADVYVSPIQIARGWTQRARSYSGNIYMGEGNAESGPVAPIYKHVRKTTDILFPTPSEAWVFLQEHPDSMNDPAFFSPQQTQWVDVPALVHNGATPFALADGHAEMHQWQSSIIRSAAVNVTYQTIFVAGPSGDADIHWMAWRTPRINRTSY